MAGTAVPGRHWLSAGLVLVAVQAALYADAAVFLAPASWGILSVCTWLLYVTSRGWMALTAWDKRQFMWGVFSAIMLIQYLQYDTEFQVRFFRPLPFGS